jgi:hypothetical protein
MLIYDSDKHGQKMQCFITSDKNSIVSHIQNQKMV